MRLLISPAKKMREEDFLAPEGEPLFLHRAGCLLEALRAMGAGRVKVFFSAVLPSAFTGMLAWTSISFESNFEASAVLGTVGAGGIGYVISNCMTRYAYGQAIVAIALVLAFTYAMELGFTAIKERNGKIK